MWQQSLANCIPAFRHAQDQHCSPLLRLWREEGTSPTTDSYVYLENIELKLNSTWDKCKVGRQKMWGRGDRTTNWNEFMNELGHWEKSSKLVPIKSQHMVSLIISNTNFNIRKLRILPTDCIYVLCDSHNDDYFLKQHLRDSLVIF